MSSVLASLADLHDAVCSQADSRDDKCAVHELSSKFLPLLSLVLLERLLEVNARFLDLREEA